MRIKSAINTTVANGGNAFWAACKFSVAMPQMATGRFESEAAQTPRNEFNNTLREETVR